MKGFLGIVLSNRYSLTLAAAINVSRRTIIRLFTFSSLSYSCIGEKSACLIPSNTHHMLQHSHTLLHPLDGVHLPTALHPVAAMLRIATIGVMRKCYPNTTMSRRVRFFAGCFTDWRR
jgi:hypothetical protein